MKHNHARSAARLWICAGLFTLLLALPAFGNDKIVKVENFGSGLVFSPLVEFEKLILTVTGPCGFDFRQEVTSGELLFKLDETTIDGPYGFNIMREEPVDPGVIEVLKEARLNFDEETPKQLCRDGKLPATPLVQAAGFRVFRGRIIYDPEAVEEQGRGGSQQGVSGDSNPLDIPFKDFVINDDLIVDGSACIGFDCVNGESFGFDTIRLKENNLRIKFDDTSVAASFPRTDWQLTANASANGGASKFSIDDISGGRTPFTVEANARSHSLYVDDGGRIGSRTSTPSTEIHTIDGDTPTLRLQQDGSSGFAPQTWDVAGNETNFFIRDVTNGSTLPFRIRPSAPTSSIFIDVDGDVGLGTASPENPLHIDNGGSAANVQVEGDNVGLLLDDDTSKSQHFLNNDLYRIRGLDSSFGQTNPGISMLTSASNVVGINCNDGVAPAGDPNVNLVIGDGNGCDGTYTAIEAGSAPVTSSSRSIKENLVAVAPGSVAEKISGIEVYTYDFIDGAKDRLGLMAEDFHQVFERGSDKTINSGEVQMALWLAVQELTDRIKTLEAELEEAKAVE